MISELYDYVSRSGVVVGGRMGEGARNPWWDAVTPLTFKSQCYFQYDTTKCLSISAVSIIYNNQTLTSTSMRSI